MGVSIPRCSMYGIFTYIWVIIGVNAVNVGKYSIHGASGIYGGYPIMDGLLIRFILAHPISGNQRGIQPIKMRWFNRHFVGIWWEHSVDFGDLWWLCSGYSMNNSEHQRRIVNWKWLHRRQKKMIISLSVHACIHTYLPTYVPTYLPTYVCMASLVTMAITWINPILIMLTSHNCLHH